MIQVILGFFTRRLLVSPPLPLRVTLLLAAILVYGATGFLYFELPANPDLTVGDAFWYSIVTMSTVGYGDFFPKSPGGRYLVGVPLMVFGIGLLGYILSIVAAALVTARTKEMQGMTSYTGSGHVVIINFPNLPKIERVLDELSHEAFVGARADIVLIDEELSELPPELASRHVHFVRGNPARDATLARASIDQAAHAVVLVKVPGDSHSDDRNLAIVLAIEGRNRKVNTVVECVDPATEELLKKAGCDRIVCLAKLDACLVSQELMNPGVQDVLDELLTSAVGQQLYLTPLQCASGTTVADLTRVARSAGHLVLGIRRGPATRLNAASGLPLEAGDIAITIGERRTACFVVGPA